MGSITNFLEDELLDHVCNAAFTPSPTLFVALCTQDPLDTATGAAMFEVPNAGAYARTAITFNAAATRRVIQTADVVFPQASAPWGTITHWAIVSTATYGGGQVYAHGSFLASFAPVNGNTPRIPAGEIEVEFLASTGAGFTDYLANNLLNLAFRNNTPAFAKPATYIGLATEVLTDTDITSGTVTEVTGGNYARKQVNIFGGATPTWKVSTGGLVENLHDITFNTPSASWGNVQSMFIADALTAGNILCFDSANVVDQTPVANDTVVFPANALDITLS
jgi:hypothetical protein